MISRIFSRLICVALAAMLAPAVFAQTSGGLSGTVKDPNAAVVQGATVTVTNKATNLTRTAVTNEDGRWTINLLPVGVYSISYEKEGFQKSIAQENEVEASVIRSVEVVLEIGGTEVFVDVTSDQPLIQAESVAVARQINGEQLTRTPTSVRSFTGLLGTEAGVSSELSPVGVNGNGNVSPSVNGCLLYTSDAADEFR
ncbi:MAG: carboxypeptidase-like regulatory domain-containing protein, partial [Pyrinomonadaceae bacterium]|nr:carboxypeptidase-like regulatory domain-containing protein [Pyrinomonadaceae bacterium]